MSGGRPTPAGSTASADAVDDVSAVSIGAVAVGAVVGSILRWTLHSWIDDDGGVASALLVANVLGALILGITVGLGHDDGRRRLAIGVGLCGGLTSFSAWSVMIAEAFEGGRAGDGTALILAHLVIGFAAFIAGRLAARRIRRLAVGEAGPLG